MTRYDRLIEMMLTIWDRETGDADSYREMNRPAAEKRISLWLTERYYRHSRTQPKPIYPRKDADLMALATELAKDRGIT